jgi:tRNA modification GTPase
MTPGYQNDTITAISTAPGRGGIGIVRLSGPHATRIASSLLLSPPLLDHAHARFARILDPERPGQAMDEAVVTAFLGPHSYTGEDVVEIATHGAPVILEAVLRGALAAGARLAEPGEFTQRAFLAGRLDLAQAEAVHDLIAAKTLDQARQAAQQLGGALSRHVAPVKEQLVHLIALLEAGMDFASGELDDVDVVAPAHIAAVLTNVALQLEALAATFQRGSLLRNGLALALVGRPNAGKSSLFNRLLQRDRAIVTPLPGTTRDTLEESFALSGIPLRLVDTAGLRDLIQQEGAPRAAALDEAERLGIARSREALADADLVLLVHDSTQTLDAPEQELLASLAGRPHLLVFNKSDLLTASAPAPREAVFTSAVTGAGLDDLRQAILHRMQADSAVIETGVLTSERQHEAIQAALAAIQQAESANSSHLAHEALLIDLHTTLRALDSLTGTTTTEDILGRIFSAFCIGK